MKRIYAFLSILLILSMACTGCGGTVATGSDNQTEAASKTGQVTEDTATVEETYANLLFDNSYVHTINVEISEEDWEDLKANPLEKTKYETNITIDGETITGVSFATKGNTSLSSIASDEDSDRYSFKLNFGHFTDGQTYHGLNKISLSNIYADATYMKDYVSYEIFRAAGVEAPLTSYVSLSINGELFGLYLAIEDMSESYLERTTDGEGILYKPESDSMEGAGGDMPEGMEMPTDADGNMEMPEGMEMPTGADGNMEMPEGMEMPTGADGNVEMPEGMEMPTGADGNMEMPEGMEMPTGADGNMEMPEGMEMPTGADGNVEMPEGMEMPGNMGGSGRDDFDTNGSDLVYTDDEISSYTDIFDNNETDADEEDNKRVIAALEGLAGGENLEEYLDTDEIIRYFAAHNFVMNYDSYTGTMTHNYYLYEKDGKLSMLPWDYNLAFGGFMSMGSATTTINYDIDSPLSGTTEDARPMWAWISQNEEYLERYHEVYDELLTNYFESGNFETEMTRVYEMIKSYVEEDPSAFYTAEEFETAYETLISFCQLRAESIRLQLNGEEANVDASSLNISSMGQMSGNENQPGGGNMAQPGDAQQGGMAQPGDAQQGEMAQPGDAQQGGMAQPGDAQQGEMAQPGDAQQGEMTQP